MTEGASKQCQTSSHKEGYTNQQVRCFRLQRNYSIFYFYQGPDKTSLTVKLKPPTVYAINSVKKYILYRIGVHFEDNTQSYIAINKIKREASGKLFLLNEQAASLIR
jgi:hypothetical protein